jgi:hypothetical protein
MRRYFGSGFNMDAMHASLLQHFAGNQQQQALHDAGGY